MAETKTIYRYTIPIDDKPHTIKLHSWPNSNFEAVLGHNINSNHVEFWAEHFLYISEEVFDLTFQVYGTGHAIPREAIYLGTCPRVLGLVFHVYMLDNE